MAVHCRVLEHQAPLVGTGALSRTLQDVVIGLFSRNLWLLFQKVQGLFNNYQLSHNDENVHYCAAISIKIWIKNKKRISKPQGCAANVHLANVPWSSWRNREGKSASKVKKVKCLSCQHCACHQPSTQYTHRHTRRHTLNGRSTSSGRPESKPNCLLKASLPHVHTVTKWQF